MEETSHKTGLVIFFGVLLLIIGAGVGMWLAISGYNGTSNADRVAEKQSTVPDANMPYTAQDVAAHAKTTNCWTIVDGKVYNLTNVIKANPGIPELEQSCGKDGTAAIKGKSFNTGEKDANGVAASQTSADLLAKYQIGRVKQ